MIIDFGQEIKPGSVGWVCGLGKAPHKDQNLEIAFYNWVAGDANNPVHAHALSTERFLVIAGGIWLNLAGKETFIGPWQMISISPGVAHNIISYEPGTVALNLRNSPQGAVGHLTKDRV